MLKKIISVILLLSVLLTLSMGLISCGGDEGGDNGGQNTPAPTPDTDEKDEKTLYTVIVMDEMGNPVSGVEIKLHFDNGNAMPFKTDANGKVAQALTSKIEASVSKIPAGYVYSKMNVKQSFSAEGILQIILEKEEEAEPLVVMVVDEDGNAIAGVTVQVCDENNSCRLPSTTDEDGKAYFAAEEVTLRAQLTIAEEGDNIDLSKYLPEGYTVENPKQYYDFVDGVATIVLKKV